MNEVSSPIQIDRKPDAPTGRRLAVVSSRDTQQPPSPGALVEMMLKVAQGRDRQAFALLFRYFGPKLKTFFLRWTMSSAAAEDLVQETMLTVWRKADALVSVRLPPSWNWPISWFMRSASAASVALAALVSSTIAAFCWVT